MPGGPNAVELTVEAAWRYAETIGAGLFPWVLAITPPGEQRAGEDADAPPPMVADWIRLVCFSERWLELRWVSARSELLRGVVARRGDRTVVALRNAHLITFTAMEIDHPHALVPVLTAGLSGRQPAEFTEFALPAHVGARADQRIRDGADVAEVLDDLGIVPSAWPVVTAAFTGPRNYVEVVAGQRRETGSATTEVGVSIVDTTAGRIVISPHRASDGEWVSTFAPATPFAIAVAVETLTATLPDGAWFPAARLTRNFERESQPCLNTP